MVKVATRSTGAAPVSLPDSPYSAAFFDTLLRLNAERPSQVLDIGCGTGKIARSLAPLVDHIDAIDPSAEMIAQGKGLPQGDHPNLHWMAGQVETFPLRPGYSLMTASERLRRMAWARILPHLGDLLLPDGLLVIVEEAQRRPPWEQELRAMLRRYRPRKGPRPAGFVERLEAQKLFQAQGCLRFGPHLVTQPTAEYVESYQSWTSPSLDGMGRHDSEAFEGEVRELISRYHPDQVTLQVTTTVVYGKPLNPARAG